MAPIIPNSEEKAALFSYLEKYSPSLRKHAPIIVEGSALQQHQELIEMNKEANKLRNNNIIQ